MGCVYWIRKPEHTDIFTEGYVGVTSKSAHERYGEHESKTRTGSALPIHNAIRKYGDILILETVVEADNSYCYAIEAKLRPTRCIRYNVDSGGYNSGRLGAKHTEEAKAKLKACAAGRVVPRSGIEKSAKANSEKVGWLCRFANKDTWKRADEVYEYMQKHPSHGYRRMSTALGTTPEQLSTMYKKIKAGWNPSEDTEWLIFSSTLTPDASGDKSIKTGVSPN